MTDQRFAQSLLDWYASHKRQLPWRDIDDPYQIWLSEIILQQTRIEQGRDYWLKFVRRFPDVASLAAASEDEVMQLWQGLGYYSRARHLHEAARQIVSMGEFPKTYESVRSLQGVGDYTAAAICSMAYGMPYAALDGNAFRVLGRVYRMSEAMDTSAGHKAYAKLMDSLLDRSHPADFNQAVMDLGATVCTPRSPHCTQCPLKEMCLAHSESQEEQYPKRNKRTPIKDRYLSYFFIICRGQMMVHRRPAGDIWQGLYEPMLIETPGPDTSQALSHPRINRLLQINGASIRPLAAGLRHILTHRILHADFYLIHLPSDQYKTVSDQATGYIWVPADQLGRYAFPVLISKVLKQHLSTIFTDYPLSPTRTLTAGQTLAR